MSGKQLGTLVSVSARSEVLARSGNYEVQFRFNGGAEAIVFEGSRDSPQDVANKLRYLADRIEQRK